MFTQTSVRARRTETERHRQAYYDTCLQEYSQCSHRLPYVPGGQRQNVTDRSTMTPVYKITHNVHTDFRTCPADRDRTSQTGLLRHLSTRVLTMFTQTSVRARRTETDRHRQAYYDTCLHEYSQCSHRLPYVPGGQRQNVTDRPTTTPVYKSTHNVHTDFRTCPADRDRTLQTGLL